ncbi:hypothetical protein BD413DRAFT_639652 [Trametes elegans]|nr:hypothetical protein BD413DRAFT_639652 [Trametes elegans]
MSKCRSCRISYFKNACEITSSFRLTWDCRGGNVPQGFRDRLRAQERYQAQKPLYLPNIEFQDYLQGILDGRVSVESSRISYAAKRFRVRSRNRTVLITRGELALYIASELREPLVDAERIGHTILHNGRPVRLNDLVLYSASFPSRANIQPAIGAVLRR